VKNKFRIPSSKGNFAAVIHKLRMNSVLQEGPDCEGNCDAEPEASELRCVI
jgi:hypothetical protein